MIDDLINRETAIEAMEKWATRPVIMKSHYFESKEKAIVLDMMGPKGKAIVLDMMAIVKEQPAIPAVSLDKLCALLAKNADCPPEHSPVQDHCKENCAECWKSVLKEWMKEQDALDRCRYTESPNYSQTERGKTLTGIDMVMVIDDAPTIDAVPMVHGRWIKGGYACGENEYKCSACGETEWRTGCARMKYCMHCGAKMDLEN